MCVLDTAKGERFNVHLKNNKDFHNPAFCDQVMQLYDLDPLGSNLDPTWAGGFDQVTGHIYIYIYLFLKSLFSLFECVYV